MPQTTNPPDLEGVGDATKAINLTGDLSDTLMRLEPHSIVKGGVSWKVSWEEDAQGHRVRRLQGGRTHPRLLFGREPDAVIRERRLRRILFGRDESPWQ